MLHKVASVRRQDVQPAHAHHQLPSRPNVAEPHDHDRHRAPAAPGGYLRHHGDAHASLDHAARRVEPAQSYPRPDGPVETRRVSGKVLGQRAPARETNEILAKRLGERHGPSLRERVPTRHHQHQSIQPERVGLQSLYPGPVRQDARLRLSLGYG